MKTNKNIALMAVLLSLLIVGSKITIPLPVIPMTLQTFMVFIIPLLVGRKNGAIVIAVYLALGLLGLPVFSSGGGITYIFSSSFGYIIGFLLAQPFISFNKNKRILGFCSELVALAIIYLAGAIHMFLILKFYVGKDITFIYVLGVGVAPFVIKDVLSICLADIVSIRLKDALGIKYINVPNLQ